MTVLLLDEPPSDLAETALVLAVLGPGDLVSVGVIARMWQGTPDRRYLGHGRNTRSLLPAFPCVAGQLAMLLS
jgi:hypothetical protein